ncbi:hypothetical protein [Streptomyces sp. NPDC002619]|uniref:hypothetical protein n=1 Tax=Streptomyces sp. NPDC002619 TaxID=3364655 RepID=UPI0036CF14B7
MPGTDNEKNPSAGRKIPTSLPRGCHSGVQEVAGDRRPAQENVPGTDNEKSPSAGRKIPTSLPRGCHSGVLRVAADCGAQLPVAARAQLPLAVGARRKTYGRPGDVAAGTAVR